MYFKDYHVADCYIYISLAASWCVNLYARNAWNSIHSERCLWQVSNNYRWAGTWNFNIWWIWSVLQTFFSILYFMLLISLGYFLTMCKFSLFLFINCTCFDYFITVCKLSSLFTVKLRKCWTILVCCKHFCNLLTFSCPV